MKEGIMIGSLVPQGNHRCANRSVQFEAQKWWFMGFFKI